MKSKLLALGMALLVGTMAASACTDIDTEPTVTNPPIQETGPGDNPATDLDPNDDQADGPGGGGLVD